MAKQRMVNTRIWSDSWVLDLDPSEKLLRIYLITNDHTDLCGIYEIHTRVISMETWFDKDMIEKMMARFIKDDKISRYQNRIYIKNFSKHQTNNPSIQKGIERSIKLIPKAILDRLYTDWGQTGDTLSHLNLDLNLNLDLDLDLNLEIYKKKIKWVKELFITEWYLESDLDYQSIICYKHYEWQWDKKIPSTQYSNWIKKSIEYGKIAKPKKKMEYATLDD